MIGRASGGQVLTCHDGESIPPTMVCVMLKTFRCARESLERLISREGLLSFESRNVITMKTLSLSPSGLPSKCRHCVRGHHHLHSRMSDLMKRTPDHWRASGTTPTIRSFHSRRTSAALTGSCALFRVSLSSGITRPKMSWKNSGGRYP